MKHNIFKRAISAVLALTMLVGVVQMMDVTSFAADTKKPQTVVDAAKVTLTGEDIIKQELAARVPVTKDRSAINANSEAAVYKDGEIYDQGGFVDMWKLAISLAVDGSGDGANNGAKSRTVEYVLNKDLSYKGSAFGGDSMTVSNKVLTIDLNGCMIYRTDGSGRVLMIDGGSKVTIMDSKPSQAHNGTVGNHQVWKPSEKGTDVIYGGIICGGYLKTSDGGGVMVDNGSHLTMTGGTIAGNKADVGSGLFIGENCSADLSRGIPEICYNYSAGTSTDGGAVFLRTNASIVGGYVHHNYADDWGGGVRAKGGNILVKDVIIYANTSEEEGGGLFIERIWTGQIVNVVGCKIIGNKAGEQGGGVYIWDNYRVNMSDCIIVDNLTDESGGGICLASSVDTPLHISGKMIVRDNFETGTGRNIKSNLYLEGNNKLVVGNMALGSEVHIRTKKHADEYNGPSKSILKEQTNSSHLFFYSDEIGYCVKYQDDPAQDNYRRMYLSKGTRVQDDVQFMTDPSPKLQSTAYTVTSGDYKDTTMPLYKGYFEYGLMTSGEFDSLSPFYYSDGYFLEDPKVYNTHLASMSINAAMAAFGRSTDLVGDNAYANHFANIKQLFSDIGCADVNFFVNEDYQMQPAYYGEDGRLSTIGVAISQKQIKAGDETYTLIPVAIRGAGYAAEWGSNVSIGASGEAKGFADAADQVYAHIQNYIENYGLTEQAANGKVKFWIVGYSRAGATANLTSKRLVDNYAELGNQVYGYTFEAPKGGVQSAITPTAYNGNGTYPTIHNTVNELDFVTLVAPGEMGFIRYGVEHLIGSDAENKNGVSNKTSSKYYDQRMKMIAQLNAIDPYYKFDDSWEVADINVVLSQIPLVGTDMIDTGEQWYDDPNEEAKEMYTFLRWFFDRVLADGLRLPTTEIVPDPNKPNEKKTVPDFSKAREYYSVRKPLASIPGNENIPGNYAYSEMTVQEALTTMMYLLMQSLTEEQQSQLITVLQGSMGDLLGGLGFSFWDQQIYNNYYNANYALAAVASVFVSFGTSFSYTIGVYADLIYSWDERTDSENAETLDWLMHKIAGPGLYSVLDDEQKEMLMEALPVVLWLALNYASADYEKNGFLTTDDGMWGVGTFVNNASTIISYHYPELNAAWIRTYDDFYTNDLQAYTIDPDQLSYKDPEGYYSTATKQLSITGEAGASIFYSLDGGDSWILYTKEVAIEDAPEDIQYFSIYHGAKSEVKTVSMNPWNSGTILGNGNVWVLILGSAFVVAFCVVAIETGRKRKKETE